MSRGEPPGFCDFVAARRPSLVRTAMLLTHDHAAAEDLVQTARGVWYDYWPDSGIGNVLGAGGNFAGPEPGTSRTITIRAVDTTGPWQVMLSWQKK